MNVRFQDPLGQTVTASAASSCGTITVTEDTSGGGGGSDDPANGGGGGSDDPANGGGGGGQDPYPGGLPVDPLLLGGGVVLALIIVAFTQL